MKYVEGLLPFHSFMVNTKGIRLSRLKSENEQSHWKVEEGYYFDWGREKEKNKYENTDKCLTVETSLRSLSFSFLRVRPRGVQGERERPKREKHQSHPSAASYTDQAHNQKWHCGAWDNSQPTKQHWLELKVVTFAMTWVSDQSPTVKKNLNYF